VRGKNRDLKGGINMNRVVPVVAVVIAVLALILSGLAYFSPEGAAPAPTVSTLEKVKREGVMRVGYIPWPPTVIKDPTTGKLSGHFIDAIEYIANELGVRIEYQEADWATFVAGLQGGRFDVVVAGTYKTIKRAASVAYTVPLFYLGNSALVRADDNRFQTLEDFNQSGIKIAVTQGTGEHDFAKTHLPKAQLIVLPGPDLTLPLLEVTTGRADAAFSDTFTISQFVKRQPNVKGLFVENPFNLTPVAWTVRPNDIEWLNFLNASLEFLEASGRLAAFEAKYDAHWLHPRLIWEAR
jgi:ABC-type amino acid transport substrate-binding protein